MEAELRTTLHSIVQILNTHSQHFDTLTESVTVKLFELEKMFTPINAEFAILRAELADLKAELKAELANFITKDDLKAELANFITKDDLKAELKAELANFVTKDDLKAELANFMTKEDFYTQLENLATKEEVDKLALLLAQTRDKVVKIETALPSLATKEDVKILGHRVDFLAQKTLVHEKEIQAYKRRVSM